jgi:hypothetical protein
VKRGLYWSAVVLGVLLLVVGSTFAVLGYAETAGPAGVVRGYFAALARGDAADALAFGDVPEGPHTLLTSEVLHAQQRVAPLQHFAIVATHRTGDRARVTVRYALAFPNSAQTINGSVPVHRAHGEWRLDEVAIPTSLELDRALQRATIVGAGIPAGDTLLFPGAVPITFDTPYLQLNAAEDSVGFGSDPGTRVFVEVSRAGRMAAVAAVEHALGACLAGRGDATCPLPSERYVPGTIRGRTAEPVAGKLTIELADDDVGVLQISGDEPVDASTYRRLTFDNRPQRGSGRVVLGLHARAYAVAPLQLVWTRS